MAELKEEMVDGNLGNAFLKMKEFLDYQETYGKVVDDQAGKTRWVGHNKTLKESYNKIAAPFSALPQLDPNSSLIVVPPADGEILIDKIKQEIQRRNDAYNLKLTSYTIPINELLDSAQLFLSQMIWLRMDSFRIYRALEPYTIAGKSLSRLVDPHPVGVFGNYLAFRWGFDRDDILPRAGAEPLPPSPRVKFESYYLKQVDSTEVATTVALPTSGVFAEAILGRGEAAEEIDVDRFGEWWDNQPPILPPNIADLTSRDRAKTMDLSTGDFAALAATLRSTPLADASHIGSIVNAATKGDMFRNMGGLDKALDLAGKKAALSEKGATRAGDRNAEMQAKFLDTFVAVLDSDIGKAAGCRAGVATGVRQERAGARTDTGIEADSRKAGARGCG